MKQVETSARRLQDAIDEGLKQLNATRDDVDIEILEQGGFFKKAKVRLTLTETDPAPVAAQAMPAVKKEKVEKAPKSAPEQKQAAETEKPQKQAKPQKPAKAEQPEKQSVEKPAIASKKPERTGDSFKNRERVPAKPVTQAELDAVKTYLEKVIALMEVTAEVEVKGGEGVLSVDLVTEDSALIGHRGEVLDALQTLSKRTVEAAGGKYTHVRIDSQGYRVRREASLVSLARRQADKCAKSGRKVTLEPMNSAHRKVVHATLGDDDRIVTKSEGREPNRRIVIFPKNTNAQQ